MKSVATLPAFAFLCAVTLSPAWAQNGPPPGGGQPPMPPQEAFTACQSISRGAACTMTTPRGTLTGTCGGPEDKPLACMPAKPPGQHIGG